MKREDQMEHSFIGKRPFAVVSFGRELLKEKEAALFVSEYPLLLYRVASGLNELIRTKGLIVGIAEGTHSKCH